MQFTYRRRLVPSMGKAALRRGLIFGLLHGIVSALLTVLAATMLTRFAGTLTLLSFPIACIFFFLAGLLTARQTQRVAGGTLAGLWTAFISKLLSTLLVAIFNLVYLLPRQVGSQASPLYRLIPFFAFEFLYLCLDISLGASFGALGGLLGKGRVQEIPPPPAPVAVSPRPIYAPPSVPPETIANTEPTGFARPSEPNPYGVPFFPPPYPVLPSAPDSPYEDDSIYDDGPDYE